MVQYIKANLRQGLTLDMVLAFKFGLMVLNMRAIGVTMLPVEEASFITLMEMSMMVFFNSLTLSLGNWVNDKANGFGVYIHANGSKY